jgi:hypothetical protein
MTCLTMLVVLSCGDSEPEASGLVRGAGEVPAWSAVHPLDQPSLPDCWFEYRWDFDDDRVQDRTGSGATDAEGRWTSYLLADADGSTERYARRFDDADCLTFYGRESRDAEGSGWASVSFTECDAFGNTERSHLAYTTELDGMGELSEYVWTYERDYEDGLLVYTRRSYYRGVEWGEPNEVVEWTLSHDEAGRVVGEEIDFNGEPYQTRVQAWHDEEQLSAWSLTWERSGEVDTWEGRYDDRDRLIGETTLFQSTDEAYSRTWTYGEGWFWTSESTLDQGSVAQMDRSQWCSGDTEYACAVAVDGSSREGDYAGELDGVVDGLAGVSWTCGGSAAGPRGALHPPLEASPWPPHLRGLGAP